MSLVYIIPRYTYAPSKLSPEFVTEQTVRRQEIVKKRRARSARSTKRRMLAK